MNLNALSSDFSLNAEQPFPMSPAIVTNTYYLTDPQGNRLTDPQGNYLVGYYNDTVYGFNLNAYASDTSLNAE